MSNTIEMKISEANDEKITDKLSISRSIFNQKKFEETFRSAEDEPEAVKCSSRFKSLLKTFDPRNILSLFSILNVITGYNVKKYLVSDLLSGITVGIMQIPQALAYGALTSLNPVQGLYTSFFPSLTYVLFATSRHLSVGTFALVSLMIYGSISRLEAEFLQNKLVIESHSTHNNLTLEQIKDGISFITENEVMDFRLNIATSLAFWCGVIQVSFSILRLGIVTKYLSQPMLRGFNTAAAFHVFTTQMQHVFGIYEKSKSTRVFKLVWKYVTIFENITSINWIAFVISVIATSLMVFTKLYINEKFRKQLKGIPLPVEIVVLIVGIAMSYFGHLNTEFGLAIVGNIPSGISSIPQPALPDFSLFPLIISDAIIISVVAIASSLSIADMYARKHEYKIHSNKEIFALGMANLSGSFFKCFTSAGALARSAVFESSGGNSQLVTVISSSIVFLVLVWIAPILETLPKACLGSIIIAALTGLFKQLRDIKHYWKLDKVDFSVWMITFLSTLLLDIDIGLCCGLLAVLFLNTYRNQRINLLELGQIKDYELFSDIKKYDAQEIENIKIVRPTQALYYINCDLLHKKLNTVCPLKAFSNTNNLYENCIENYGCNSNSENDLVSNLEADKLNRKKIQVHAIILDFSLVTFVDEAGVKCLMKIIKEYSKQDIQILITNANDSVLEFFDKMGCEWNETIYLTVRDAIQSTMKVAAKYQFTD